jgi:hypothetical protein
MDKRHYLTRPPAQARIAAHAEAPARLVDEHRAAALLGVSAEKLRRLSSETGLGRTEQDGEQQVVFTYAELYRLCRSAVHVAD